ncbi:AbrB/MazE/SpoVT family DNA-binding domain-containing protein [Thermodesulfatator indicus]
MEAMLKIFSKGQVTIPKKMRQILGTDLVRFRVVEGKIILEPVRNVGGIFKKYVKEDFSHSEKREIAWQKVADGYRDLP